MSDNWLNRTLTRLRATNRSQAPRVAALAPQALEVATEQVRQLLIDSRFAEAEVLLFDLRRSNPDDVKVLGNSGICCYFLEDTEQAIQLLEATLAIEPGHALAAKFLAACFERVQRDADSGDVNQLAVQLNPSDSEVLLVAAARDIRMGRVEQAANLLNRTLAITPENPTALNLLDQLSKQSTLRRGLFSRGDKIPAARRRMEQRLIAKEKKEGLSEQELAMLLSSLENDANTFASAHILAARAQQHEPMNAALAEQIASVYWLAGDGATMLRMRQQAHQLDPESVVTQIALNHAELMQDPHASTKTWRSLHRLLVATRPYQHPQQIAQWRGERLGKKRLLVYQDQGVGDALICFRLIRVLEERAIAFDFWVVPKLRRLAQRALPNVIVLDGPEFPDAPGNYDFAISLFGLIDALRIDQPETLPQTLFNSDTIAQPAKPALNLSHLQGKRIGLLYGGNPDRRDDWVRSVDPAALSTFCAIKGVSWVSLLSDSREDRAAALGLLPMTDPMQHIDDFLDTATIIGQLDAVVAIDSSVAHLTAAIGKPLWLAAPSMLDWRWQMAERLSPWWPDTRMHRSETPGDFDATIGAIAKEISDAVSAGSL